jgi:hypothetical protein
MPKSIDCPFEYPLDTARISVNAAIFENRFQKNRLQLGTRRQSPTRHDVGAQDAPYILELGDLILLSQPCKRIRPLVRIAPEFGEFFWG